MTRAPSQMLKFNISSLFNSLYLFFKVRENLPIACSVIPPAKKTEMGRNIIPQTFDVCNNVQAHDMFWI